MSLDTQNVLETLEAPELRKVKGMSRDDVRKELQNRGIQPVGIHSEDMNKLRAEFQKEYDAAEEVYLAAKQEREERLREDEENLRRAQETIKHEKEQKKLIKDFPALRLFLELMTKNKTSPEAVFTGTPTLSRAIASRLGGCTSLVALDLSNGTLCDGGCQALSRGLEAPDCHLQRLEMNRNGIGPVGARSLGQALVVNKSLLSLSLEDNDLTNNYQDYSGVDSFASMFEANSTLTSVNLNRTMLGVNGVGAINLHLKRNDTIVILELDFNGNSSFSDQNEIAAKIIENKILREKRLGEEKVEEQKRQSKENFERLRQERKQQEEEEAKQADERARVRQEERERLYAEAKETRRIFLEEAHEKACQRQMEWQEKELAKKKKGKKK